MSEKTQLDDVVDAGEVERLDRELQPTEIGAVSELTGNDPTTDDGGDSDNIVWGQYN